MNSAAHHKTGDFPHLRHLVSLSEPGKGHHRRHHHHHKKGKKHRPEKQQEEVSDTAEVTNHIAPHSSLNQSIRPTQNLNCLF